MNERLSSVVAKKAIVNSCGRPCIGASPFRGKMSDPSIIRLLPNCVVALATRKKQTRKILIEDLVFLEDFPFKKDKKDD
jgi:hypothetical protein